MTQSFGLLDALPLWFTVDFLFCTVVSRYHHLSDFFTNDNTYYVSFLPHLKLLSDFFLPNIIEQKFVVYNVRNNFSLET